MLFDKTSKDYMRVSLHAFVIQADLNVGSSPLHGNYRKKFLPMNIGLGGPI